MTITSLKNKFEELKIFEMIFFKESKLAYSKWHKRELNPRPWRWTHF